jgi:hypothetical protein
MQHLDLCPLPCAASTENPRSILNAGLGFVDDAVVMALLTGAVGSRFPQNIVSLGLTSDEMDYAGWPPSMLNGAHFLRSA